MRNWTALTGHTMTGVIYFAAAMTLYICVCVGAVPMLICIDGFCINYRRLRL